MKFYRAFAVLFCAVFLNCGWAFANTLSIPKYTAEQEAILSDGGHVVEVWRDKTRDDGALDVFGAIDIAAPAAVIWKIMLDCDRAKIIVPDMKTCEILETAQDGSWDMREQKLKIAPLLPKSISIFRSDYDINKSIKISLVGGNMKIQDGLWTLAPLKNGETRVAYRATVLSNFAVPRGLIKRAMRKDVPTILSNMRIEAQKDYKAASNQKP